MKNVVDVIWRVSQPIISWNELTFAFLSKDRLINQRMCFPLAV